jgi:hypothetical protein
MGLELDEVAVSGSDVEVHSDPFALSLGANASAIVRVSCESIRSYLSTLDLGGLRDVTVETENGLLKVSGTVVVLVPVRATAFCALVAREAKFLDIVLEAADPGAAFSLIERQLKGVNPVLDLSDLFLDVSITTVEAADGWVEMRARAGTRVGG